MEVLSNMKITVQSSKAVKPSYGVPGGAPSVATDTITLTVLDKVNFDQYISNLYFFPARTASSPPNAVLEQGLSKALAVHRHWAGQFGVDANGDRAIIFNDACVRFVEATVDVELSTIMPVVPNPQLLRLHPSGDGAEELMLVQVTRFGCGSIAVGTTTGEKVVVQRVHFNTEMVSKLKAQASSSAGEPQPYSTVKCVAAHLWRCITAARGLAGDTATTLKIAVNGRRHMRHPEVPEGYAGNVVLWAHPTTTAGELVTKPLSDIADLISREVALLDDRYFRSFVDFASSGAVEEEGLVPAADPMKTLHCPDVEVYSQMGIPVYDVDFGAGRPLLYMPAGYLPEEGLVFIVPSPEDDGSVDAQVCLFSRAMDVFKSSCYSVASAHE